VAHRPRTGGRRRDRLPHHPEPRGSRPARRPDAVLDQGHLVAEGTPGELKRQLPGSHIRLQFTDLLELDAAARVLPGSTRDDEDLTLRVPGDGRAKSLRALLDRLDEHSIDVEDLAVHTPDLDDVFLALTSHASTEENAR
jgi:ABC-2 type transport system ATP-binding protein